MRSRSYALMIAGMLFMTPGCGTIDDEFDTGPSGTPEISFVQVKAVPDSYRGQTVTFGGEVLGAKRLKEGTRIEILQLPLTSSLQPTLDLSKSQGRFVAMQKEFLDPATVPSGIFVTITGEISGSVTMPLDEIEYTYPIVDIKTLRVWMKPDESAVRIRPYMGPAPYWGPYGRPYPFW